MLYGIHCVFAGLAYMLMHLFNVGVGMTFSGGLIDMFLFGILQGNAKTNWIWIVIVGIGYFIVYYLLFGFLIKRFDLKTPGRDDSEEVKLYRRSDVEARKNGDNGSEASSKHFRRRLLCNKTSLYRSQSRMRRRCTVKINWCIRRSTQRKWRSDYLRTSRISHQIKPRRLPRDCARRRIHSWRK